VAQSLLGYDFKGILTSDRYGAYNWLEVASRQVCWAHLKRDFIQIAERTGASAELGTALLEQKHLFALWYQVRDGTLSRPDLIAAVVRIRARVHELCMKQPVTRSLHRRNAVGKTVRTCRQLLQLEPAMWLSRLKGWSRPTTLNGQFVLPCCGDAPVSVLRAKQEVSL